MTENDIEISKNKEFITISVKILDTKYVTWPMLIIDDLFNINEEIRYMLEDIKNDNEYQLEKDTKDLTGLNKFSELLLKLLKEIEKEEIKEENIKKVFMDIYKISTIEYPYFTYLAMDAFSMSGY